MRRHRSIVVGTVAALAVLGISGTAQADSGSGRGGGAVIEMEDRCDPATFNAAIGEGTCVGDGDDTFAEFLAEFQEDGEVGHWRFHPEETQIRAGQPLKVVNVGGEVHTFTRVDDFTAIGCIPLLNENQAPPNDRCDEDAFATATGPGGVLRFASLSPGRHLFQCFIHPWMQSVVTVRR